MTETKDMIRDDDIVRATVAHIELTSDDYAAVKEARRRNPLLHIDHYALGCRNAEETRKFYEDLLGMPLVNAVVLDDPFSNDGTQYCHFFFEMANGNFLAFFDHEKAFGPEDFKPRSGWHQHMAMEVSNDETVQAYRKKLTAAGVESKYIDHGMYHSLYFNDPNGINLEITYKTKGTAEHEVKARKVARSLLDAWTSKHGG